MSETRIGMHELDTEACLRSATPFLWLNTEATPQEPDDDQLCQDVDAAEHRLARAGSLLSRLFPEPQDARFCMSNLSATHIENTLIKCDHAMPLAGSIKARGGFHEVIALAERLALRAGLITENGDLAVLARPDARAFFAKHTISVGSTGNLGLSIGIIASALGFRTVVHMSRDAKDWKKKRLRDRGVNVVEHDGDYGLAVDAGRKQAAADPQAHFIDDERSVDLLTGYAAAAREIAEQLDQQGYSVGEDQPLFVHIPCGVGGAAGGIAFGLKRIFGRHVYCFFIEPVASPCLLVQLASRSQSPVSVYDIGLDNRTEADGLAVAQASMMVASLMRTRLSGICTVSDAQLFALLLSSHRDFGLDIEPSAAAAFAGPLALSSSPRGRAFMANLGSVRCKPIHVIWTTGGALVPDIERQRSLERANGIAAELDWR